MKRIGKWLAGVLGTALSVVLIVVLLPYAGQIADAIFPHLIGSGQHRFDTLTQAFQEKARLETLQAEHTGVLTHEVDAAFIGTVSTTRIAYAYHGSYGIDLSRVVIEMQEGKVCFILPPPELIQDDISVTEMDHVGVMDSRVRLTAEEQQALLDEEKLRIRDSYLSGEHVQTLCDRCIAAFQDTIAAWMSQTDSRLEYTWQWAEPQAE